MSAKECLAVCVVTFFDILAFSATFFKYLFTKAVLQQFDHAETLDLNNHTDPIKRGKYMILPYFCIFPILPEVLSFKIMNEVYPFYTFID